jgi:hypothetical protein
MHTFILTRSMYTQNLCCQYTCIYWQFQCILYLYMLTVSIHSSLRTVLLTQSVMVLTHIADVRINVIIICSFVCRSGSQMRVCESHATFCYLDSKVAFLRTGLPWARTAHSIFGFPNLFLRLLCIHPSILHICSEKRYLSWPNTISSRTMPGCQTKPVPFHPWHLAWTFSPSSVGTCSYFAVWRRLRVGHPAFHHEDHTSSHWLPLVKPQIHSSWSSKEDQPFYHQHLMDFDRRVYWNNITRE